MSDVSYEMCKYYSFNIDVGSSWEDLRFFLLLSIVDLNKCWNGIFVFLLFLVNSCWILRWTTYIDNEDANNL